MNNNTNSIVNNKIKPNSKDKSKDKDKDKDIVQVRHPKTYKPLSKKAKKLPSNFFERMLILEMHIRNDFSSATLDELVQMYTIAVEFYENREDNRAQDYQLRMATLLSDPDILRYISEGKKKKAALLASSVSNANANTNTNPNAKHPNVIINDSHPHLLNEKKKNQLKLKVNYIQKYTPDNLEQTLGGILKKEEEKNSGDVKLIIKNEFSKQREQWTQKLKHKKRIIKAQSQINSPDVTYHRKEDQSTPKLINSNSVNNNNDSNSNNMDIIIPNIPMPINKKKEEEYDPEVKFKNSLQDKLIELDNLITTIDEESSPQRTNDEDNAEFDLSKLPYKFQNSFITIDEKVNGYINNFNAYFYKDIFESFFIQLKKLIDEKYEQYIKISQLYHSQIKEKEFLIDPDKENDEEQENLKQIIEGLKEEQEHEIGRIDIKYNSMINEKVTRFKMESFKNNSGLQVIEEQFKLDVYQLISDVL